LATPLDQRMLRGLLRMWGTMFQAGRTGSIVIQCFSHAIHSDIIACIVEQQLPLPPGLDGGGSILQYVEYMSGSSQQQQQQLEHQQGPQTDAEGDEHVTAYIKGGVTGWQGEAQLDVDVSVERIMLL
jgi:hypothetical protein